MLPRFSFLIFIACSKWVHTRVVEKVMATISLGKGLGPDVEMEVGNKRRSLVLVSPMGGPGLATERLEIHTAPLTPSWNYHNAISTFDSCVFLYYPNK